MYKGETERKKNKEKKREGTKNRELKEENRVGRKKTTE
jgi:hypothetical protein